jgi:glycosyltransferase involved in cell wall biosynthesis
LKETLEIKKITEHQWLEDSLPIVSISCIAFNQAKYIRETLDGFLDQETNFLVEILIHDDASSDGTDLIILEYSKKYPNIFKPILQKENQYSKIGFSLGFLEYNRARGKYIAICEGDDYWSDERKLLKQVELLENDSNAAFCFHSTEYLYITGEPKLQLKKPTFIPSNNRFGIKDLIELDSQLISNCSVMMRTNLVQQFPNWVNDAPVGDLPLCLYLGTIGSMAFIEESMAVYRVNSIGSWSNEIVSSRKYRIAHLIKLRSMWIEFDKWTRFEFTKSIKLRIVEVNRAILIARLSNFKLFRLFLKFLKSF